MNDPPFTERWLRKKGFEGFVRFADLDMSSVPTEAGVYVLLRVSNRNPEFLPTSPAGWFKGRNPTAALGVLEDRWVEGTPCVYIGKADKTGKGRHLRKRLSEFREFGGGCAIGHWGGRYVWQVADAFDYLVAWRTTDENPVEVENQLVNEFETLFGCLPFGNINRPRRSSR